METSQTIGKISEALAKAQGMMKPAAFDATNPHFKSKYATLASIMEAARPALSANGIAVIQGTSVEGEPIRVKVTTLLTHVSGEWIKETISIKPARDDAQGIGSSVTYARRYSLAALVGIVSDEDDDGNAASQPAKPSIIPIRKAPEKSNSETPKPGPIPTPPESPTPSPVLPKQINNRVLKLREIFQISGRIGHSPAEMKEMIGSILKLDRPLKESSEISDTQLEIVLQAFRKAQDTLEKSAKKEAA